MADEALEPTEELLLTDEVEQEAPEVVAPPEEEEILTFGDEPTEVQETDNATIRHLREELKRARKEAAEVRKPKVPEAVEDLGPEPELEDFDYDPEAFKAAHRKWVQDESRIQATKGQTSEAEQAKMEATRLRIEKEKLELGRKNIDVSFNLVRDTLNDFQQSLLVKATEKTGTAKMIAALGDNPSKLDELASITDAVEFIQTVTRLGDKIQMPKRKAPISPDTPERGSAKSSVSVGAAEKQLAKMEADWKGGDRSHIQKFKREHGIK